MRNLHQVAYSVCSAGHDHIYERTCSIFNFTCMPNNADGSQGGVTHVVCALEPPPAAPTCTQMTPRQNLEHAMLSLTSTLLPYRSSATLATSCLGFTTPSTPLTGRRLPLSTGTCGVRCADARNIGFVLLFLQALNVHHDLSSRSHDATFGVDVCTRASSEVGIARSTSHGAHAGSLRLLSQLWCSRCH